MAIFPSSVEKPTYPLKKIPEFSTNIIDYGNKTEQRVARWSKPRYKFELDWEVLSQEDQDTILQFFIARKGAYESFYWANPEEAYGYPAWQASEVYSLNDIVRPTTENDRSYKCIVAGTSSGLEPSWPTTVSGTVVDGGVTWEENSYTVRFETDMVNFDYFTYQLYNLNRVVLVEVAE